MNTTTSPAETWTDTQAQAATFITCPHHAALFLGTIFAYPLHATLRENFGLLPGAWLFSPEQQSRIRNLKSSTPAIADFIHGIYHADPLETAGFCTDQETTTQSIIQRMAAYPHAPWICSGYNGIHPPTEFLTHSCETGIIPRGVYGTRTYRVDRLSPPVVISPVLPPSELASRFLLFHQERGLQSGLHSLIHPLPINSQPSTLNPQQSSLSTLLPHLIADRSWCRTTLRHSRLIERGLAADLPDMPFRHRVLLAIAAGVFTATEEILNPPASSSPPTANSQPSTLPSWLTTHHASLFHA